MFITQFCWALVPAIMLETQPAIAPRTTHPMMLTLRLPSASHDCPTAARRTRPPSPALSPVAPSSPVETEHSFGAIRLRVNPIGRRRESAPSRLRSPLAGTMPKLEK
jgi:hypothetical protein